MKPITKDQQLDNCVLALAHWVLVDPRTVRLKTWRCGTLACFGGHLATWPEFKAQGVRAATAKQANYTGLMKGTPIMLNPDDEVEIDGTYVAGYLFGCGTLFASRGHSRFDTYIPDNYSDHQVVVERLHRQIEDLSLSLNH